MKTLNGIQRFSTPSLKSCQQILTVWCHNCPFRNTVHTFAKYYHLITFLGAHSMAVRYGGRLPKNWERLSIVSVGYILVRRVVFSKYDIVDDSRNLFSCRCLSRMFTNFLAFLSVTIPSSDQTVLVSTMWRAVCRLPTILRNVKSAWISLLISSFTWFREYLFQGFSGPHVAHVAPWSDTCQMILGDARMHSSVTWVVTAKLRFGGSSAGAFAPKARGVFELDVSVRKEVFQWRHVATIPYAARIVLRPGGKHAAVGMPCRCK